MGIIKNFFKRSKPRKNTEITKEERQILTKDKSFDEIEKVLKELEDDQDMSRMRAVKELKSIFKDLPVIVLVDRE